MGSPEHVRSYEKRNAKGNSDVRSSRGKDEDWEGDDTRRHRSSRSKRSGNGEDAEGVEGSGRKRNSGDRNENRKRSAGSSITGSDEDEYQAKKESRSKQMKKQEESALEKLSNWYQDGEAENKHDSGEKSGHKVNLRADENERNKSISKISDHESSKGRTKGKDERSYAVEIEKIQEKDRESRPERRENSREKGHRSFDYAKNSRGKLDESDNIKETEDTNVTEKSEVKLEKFSAPNIDFSNERNLPSKTEVTESKSRDVDLNSGKVTKSHDKEERRDNIDNTKSKARSEATDEDNKGRPLTCEDNFDKEKLEEHRLPRNSPGHDVAENHERSFNADEEGNTWMRETTRRDTDHSNCSKSPERSGRHYHDSDHVEMEYERNLNSRRTELEKDGYRDDRFKGRDDSWSDRNRDQEGSRDNWKQRQLNITGKDTKDRDMNYDHGREWELQRRGRERVDSERHQGRLGGRKDGNRTEAVKTSSNYGISNENYDVIEIQTKPFDYGREEPRSRSNEAGQPSATKVPANDEEYDYQRDSKARSFDSYGPRQPGEDLRDRYMDDGPAFREQNPWRDENDFQTGKPRGQRGAAYNRVAGGQSSSSGSQPPQGYQEGGSFNRTAPQGTRGNRIGRGGRVRPTGRDNQQVAIPVPMMGSSFRPLGMPPPGAMQPLTPSMSPGPPISPGVFIPPFSPPVVWPGARGVDMNLLAVPPGLSPVPPGPSGPRYSPNIGTPSDPVIIFNQPGPGRGGPPNIAGASFNAMVAAGRGQPQENDWVPPRVNVPLGKAPSRGEQNDYSQNFVDTGLRPQNYIRELELTSVVEDYPKLRELIQKKDEIVAKSSNAPMYYKCDLREQILYAEFFGTKFDVILVDPPWEEYVHRAPGVTDHMEYWTFEEIMNLKIEAIADTPSFIFLWVGDGVGLEQGRQCLKKWGFRRCEDICWVKTNKANATPGSRHDSHTLFQRSKEHCLMGIKGTVRRSTDGHIIHANIDTDVIIAEEPPYGSTAKPEDMYRIIEHFSLGRRRLELFGEDHNIRAGWLTIGKDLSSSNFNSEAYVRNFADKGGKIWQGGGGRNPPPEAGHLVLTTPDIEALRPKSPMKNQQQMQQQQTNSISLTAGNSASKMPGMPSLNDEASGANISTQFPWASQMDSFRGSEGNMGPDDRVFDTYAYNAPLLQPNRDFIDYESQRAMNMY